MTPVTDRDDSVAAKTWGVAEPLTYDALKKSMDAIRDEPRRVHGTESDPHLVSASAKIKTCIVCGRVVK